MSTVYADKEEYMRLLETERRHTALLQDLEALPAVGTLRDAPVVALADLRAVIEAAQAPR